MSDLRASPAGLSSDEAARRLAAAPARVRRPGRGVRALRLLAGQFASPIVLALIGAAVLSRALGEGADAAIILVIVLASALLGFVQEWRADDAVAELLAMVRVKATVLRDGRSVDVPLDEVVPGDVALLHAGDVVPGDGRLIEARDLFAAEAALTGETFPVEKIAGGAPDDAPLAARAGCLFLGTSVVSGTGRLLVVRTGGATEFGRISESLRLRPPETEFERGVRHFGAFLLEVTLLLVMAVFVVNVAFHRPILESFLFALAIAVGLTPQLLPAIIGVNLAHGARRMAQRRVIVRRLAAIEDLGGMDVLCSDKTGTLTEGRVVLREAVDPDGNPSEKARLFAYLNASMQSGYANPIDRALVAGYEAETSYSKLDEEPYDFVRKRLSVLVAGHGPNRIITKGALAEVLDVCTEAETAHGSVDLSSVRGSIEDRATSYFDRGYRVLGIAFKEVGAASGIDKVDEAGLTFLGLLAFDDPLRPGIAGTLRALGGLGIDLKLITGDHRRVAAHAARGAGLPEGEILTGPELRRMSEEALVRRARDVTIFAEVEPNQKERVILALKKAGHAVGFLGDGINDAPALHAADVGISVADAVDVAREAAQVVLLEKDLAVLEAGVREGRRTFANTLKYVYMATSANFGNMFSLAAASLFLPFLPLLPKQVLLMNLLTDLPEMAIASDSVDPELVVRPRRWDVRDIRNFMVVFGAISSVFDMATFGVLLGVLRTSEEAFRTGWFLESVISASIIVLVIRTRRPIWASRPGRALLGLTVLVVGVALLLPWTGWGAEVGFLPPRAGTVLAMGGIVAAYVASAEVVKRLFYRREPEFSRRPQLQDSRAH